MTRLATMLQVGRTFGVRDGLLRLQYELRRGSGLMQWRMRSVQGWESWDLRTIAPGATADQMLASRCDSGKFFFRDAPSLAAPLRTIIGREAESAVLRDAGRIISGELPYFGRLWMQSGFPPQWFRNPATGQSVPPRAPWTSMRFASPVYGDLKFILEPSRFLFVYPLARAYALSGDERFAEAFWLALEDWAQQNPPMSGPLWICGQECSLRILAWSFALHAFVNASATTGSRVARLISMIAAHAWRTAQTLGYARSQRSNHLISEAVGLWTAGVLYPELREAKLWQELGSHLLHEAVLDQITPEGVSQQHSFNYQRMILHLLLWALRLAEIRGIDLHPEIRARAESAFDFMRGWVDPISASAPRYGSDDGSLIFPLAQGDYADFRSLIQLGAAVLGKPAWKTGPWDEAALWFGAKPEKLTSASAPLIETGYFRLGDEKSWAMIRAGRYTRRPFQADQLHVDLWWRGINLARDPGTYLYNGPEPWNNGFAGTAVHNTITVDGADQMRRAGRFLWVDWAQAHGRMFSSSGNGTTDRFEGEHDGYARLGVTHRRSVQWLSQAGWVIVDDVLGSGEHEILLHWLLPDLPFEVCGNPFKISLDSPRGQVRWSIAADIPGKNAVVRSGRPSWFDPDFEIPPLDMQRLGWESPAYGELSPALSLVHKIKSSLPVRILTIVLTDERAELAASKNEIAVTGAAIELHRVSLQPKSFSAKHS
ncbi:MAG TPA: alginate lyase family protein [Candidatus Binatia bacterium]|nr:alginate lyase family protein [Candidatus Binatia bacterium]